MQKAATTINWNLFIDGQQMELLLRLLESRGVVKTSGDRLPESEVICGDGLLCGITSSM